MSNKAKWNITGMLLVLLVLAMVSFGCVAAYAAPQTKADSDLLAASQVVFGPKDGRLIVKAMYVVAGDGGSLVFMTKSGDRLAPTSNQTNSAVLISIENSTHAMTTNDWIVYVHANGTLDTSQAASSTTNTVTLGSAITVAGATGDYLYEVVSNGVITLTAATAFNQDGPVMYATPTDSPLVIQTVSVTTNTLLITVDDQ